MNLNVNSVNFGRWEAGTYRKILSEINHVATSRGKRPEDTPLYRDFIYIHEHTGNSSLKLNNKNRIEDQNKAITYFPYTKSKNNVIIKNVRLAAEKLRKSGASSEDVELGLEEKTSNQFNKFEESDDE